MNETTLRARCGFIVLLSLIGAPALADSLAVSNSNYEMNFHSGDTLSSGDRVSYFHALAGRATFPLATYLGVSLSGNYANTTLIATPDSNITGQAWENCGYHSKGLGATLFARAPSLGRIGIGYNTNQLDTQCGATFIIDGSTSLTSDTYSADAEYYFSRVTLAANWARSNITDPADLTTATFTTSWYPTDLSRFSIAAGGLDIKDTYSVEVEYQPEFLDNLLGVRLNYTSQHQTISTQSITIGISYYFGANADLITRDRSYR